MLLKEASSHQFLRQYITAAKSHGELRFETSLVRHTLERAFGGLWPALLSEPAEGLLSGGHTVRVGRNGGASRKSPHTHPQKKTFTSYALVRLNPGTCRWGARFGGATQQGQFKGFPKYMVISAELQIHARAR
jgi:hypothetical protein